jgi:hypothetical protein
LPANGRLDKASRGAIEMKKLLIIPTLFILSCSSTRYIEKPVYLKCSVPEVPKTQKPTLKPEMSYPEKLQNLLNYMFELEKENNLLREAIKTCNN